MNKATFLAVATALSATIGFAQAGIVTLPIDEAYRAIIAFSLGIFATFLASFIKAETP